MPFGSIQEVSMIKNFFNYFLIFSLFSASTSFGAELVDKIVAIVNSEIILDSDFKLLALRAKNSTLMDESLLGRGSLANLRSDRKVQLDYLIHEKLFDAEIKRLNLSVTSERVQQEIKDMGKRNNMSAQDVMNAVKAQGISASEYQAFLKTKIERQSLVETEIVSKLRITDDDALAEYIKRHPDSKRTVHEFSVAHIFFNPKKGGAEEAYSRATKVLQQLNSGTKFEVLAEKHSEDPNYAAGGFLGNFKSGEFLPEVEAAILNLNPNDTTSVVKSKLGFHIVKLISKKAGLDSAFEKEKPRIISELMDTNFRRQLKIWLQSKKEEAFIRINGTEK